MSLWDRTGPRSFGASAHCPRFRGKAPFHLSSTPGGLSVSGLQQSRWLWWGGRPGPGPGHWTPASPLRPPQAARCPRPSSALGPGPAAELPGREVAGWGRKRELGCHPVPGNARVWAREQGGDREPTHSTRTQTASPHTAPAHADSSKPPPAGQGRVGMPSTSELGVQPSHPPPPPPAPSSHHPWSQRGVGEGGVEVSTWVGRCRLSVGGSRPSLHRAPRRSWVFPTGAGGSQMPGSPAVLVAVINPDPMVAHGEPPSARSGSPLLLPGHPHTLDAGVTRLSAPPPHPPSAWLVPSARYPSGPDARLQAPSDNFSALQGRDSLTA